MHETMRRSFRGKMVRNDDTNQEATTIRHSVVIKLGKKNQADEVLTQNLNNQKPPALSPLSPKSWPNGASLQGMQLPPIYAPTPHIGESREPLRVTSSIVNERKGASRKCAPSTQRPLDSGTIIANIGGKASQVPTIRVNGSEKVSLYMTKDRLSLVKSTPASKQDGLKMSVGGPRANKMKKGKRQQRENGRGDREESVNLYQDHPQKSPKLRLAHAPRPFTVTVNDCTKNFDIKPSTEVDLHIRTQTPESVLQDPRLYRYTQPPFRVPPLRPVLPPIGGPRPGGDKQARKRDKKKSREARRREKEKEMKLKLLEEDLKLKAFFQSLAMNRRDATCMEVDKLFNGGLLVKFSESLVLLSAMQWWL